MGARAAGGTATEWVLSRLAARRDELVERWLGDLVPGVDPALVGDIREAAERSVDLLLAAIAERRVLTRDDVLFARPYFRHAMLRGADEAEMLRACRQSQRVVWDALSEIAGDTRAGRAVVAELSRPLIDYVEVFSDIAAETYAEVKLAAAGTRSQTRSELVEDLLAGRTPGTGAKRDAARAADLAGTPAFVVLTAVPAGAVDEAGLAIAAATLTRAPGDPVEPLVAVRERELVIIRAMHDDAERLVEMLMDGHRRLHADEIPLRIGVSAVHTSLLEVPAAYEEAWLARERADPAGELLGW